MRTLPAIRRGAFSVPDRLSRGLPLETLEHLGEALPSLAGARLRTGLHHAVAVFLGVEDAGGRDPRPAAKILQDECLDRDVTRQAFPLEGLDDLLWRHDLAIHTIEPVLATVGRAGYEPPGAAWSDIHLVDDRLVPPRPPPLRDERRVGDRFEDELARRIELAGDDDLTVATRAELGGAFCRGHSSSPLVSVLCRDYFRR